MYLLEAFDLFGYKTEKIIKALIKFIGNVERKYKE